MRQELIELLNRYLWAEVDLHACYEWLAGISWDDPEFRADLDFVSVVGALELLALEALESIRPESEFKFEAARFLNRSALITLSMLSSYVELFNGSSADESSIHYIAFRLDPGGTISVVTGSEHPVLA